MEEKNKELDYMLKIINAYEETDRVSIALNTIEKVEQFTKLTDTRKICEWVMKCSDYGQYKTVYTWIAPNPYFKGSFKSNYPNGNQNGYSNRGILEKK